MTPTPHYHKDLEQTLSDMNGDRGAKDKVVISGMSGLYPNSRSVKEFSDLLYNKVNLVTNEGNRWEFNHPEVNNYLGKISNLDRFDANFFKVHYRQAVKMDPMSRKLLELTYEAIYDAGMNPKEFNGKNVGVFIGIGISEYEGVVSYESKSKTGFGITGTSKTMYANRISYWLNCKGPSVSLDGGCCGSMVVLEQAVQAINRGDCDAAIVGAASISLLPQTIVNFGRCIKLSADGKTKCFADNADGCSKSDAINVLLLQKSRDALRLYGEVVHVKNEFVSRIAGTGQVFGFNRDLNSYTSFLKQFYEEVNVAPDAVKYVEAFGSASPEADKTELQAIDNVFCRNRTDPLLVGSVMSNVGFTDVASGLTAITKVLLGYHKGEIAANLNCERPRQDIIALREGRIQVVTDHKPVQSTYAAVNGLSYTGINSHVLLNGHFKPKDVARYNSAIPRLVTVSTRIDATLQKIFDDLKSRPVDPEEIALLHNMHADNFSGHLGRGYIVLGTNDEQETVCLGEKAQYVNDADRPLWFVYSGMGSQWTAMGAQLMRIPIFAAAIERCHKVLKPLGLDIVDIITSLDETLLKNIQNTFVGIAAIQIGLTDILKEIGLIPDKIIGHSVGELGCAYADGCLTAEEMIMAAYYRGRVSLETKFIRGAMAAVGLGYQQINKICPPEIEVACHNGPKSCTISGPAEKIKEFTAKLTADGIFAKEVPSSNIAYHSRYIAAAGPLLLQNLSGLITHPKSRSNKWVSTSVPVEKWNEPNAKLCSAEYLTNNLLSPVLFEEASQYIPSNALLVEIAPHGLLQAILKRSLPETCKNIALTQRGHTDNAVFLLNAIGQLYVEGFSPKLQVLYPKVEFPVSTGTPHLSHHVEWMHSELWDLAMHVKTTIKKAASCNFFINLHSEEHSYLKGNTIRGKMVYPFAAALVAAWDTLAMCLGAPKKSKSIQFRDLHLYSQPILHDSKQLKLSVNLHRGTGLFDVLDGSSKVISGFISTFYDYSARLHQSQMSLDIGSEEVYQNLSSRGYGYTDGFRSINKVNEDISEAELIWNDNWVTLIDGMLQLNTLKHNGVAQPYQIRELTIDLKHHTKLFNENKSRFRATVDPIIDATSCGGVVMRNIKFRNFAIESPEKITLELLSPTNTKNGNQVGKNVNKYAEEQRLSLAISNIGDIDTLHWKEVGNISTNDIKVKVQYAGLNVTDTKRASGVLPFVDGTTFGMEFSGLTESGDRVMGLVKNGAVSTIVAAQPDLLWPVPAHWSLEDAATVPLAYAQAFYCLKIKNRLERNSRVLIHGGAGALGQAAISIALAMGCQIFTTVADQSKKRFLRKLFPQLKEEHIGNSRDSSFADIVLNATNSEGCDIILSCVKGDLRNECLKCTAQYGTTVDTSLLQSREDFVYGMSYMTRCRSFMAVDFKSIFEPEYSTDLKYIQELVSEGIAQGYVRPLSRLTYAPGEASRAFRLLAASRHRGRVLLRLRDQPLAQPRISCTSELCHVIFSDDDFAAHQVADRLVARGATKLRIHCFNSSSTHALKIRSWKNQGVKAHATFGLLSSDDIVKALNECEQIEGLYVMVLNKASNFKEMKAIVEQITGAARASIPQLKYFAVASNDSNIILNEALFSQSVNGLPKTIIIPDLVRVNKEYNLTIDVPTWNRIMVDVVERALLCDYPVLVAKPHLLQQMSLLQQLGSIAGIGNLFSYNDDTTLNDLNIENEELNMIKLYLQDTYHVTLEIEEIRELTKNKIRQIELSAIGEDFEDVKGLSCFYSYVDLDELQGTADFQQMVTLTSSNAGIELHLNEKYLSIVTGMEGHHDRFRSMCKSLKLQAIVLQPGLDNIVETPKELAQRYSKILLNKLGVKDYFYLLGYEYGVIVALELAAILEANGKTGTVFLIGDTPNGIRAQIEEQIAGYPSEAELQVEIISHMFRLMSVEDTTMLTNAMKGCSSWEERASACVSLLIGQVSHSAQYARAVLDAAYARITTARTCNFTAEKIKSKIVLMRAKSAIRDETQQQLSEQPVDVYELAASLAHATKDLRCSAIINKYLSEDLLNSFESSNTCTSYVMT